MALVIDFYGHKNKKKMKFPLFSTADRLKVYLSHIRNPGHFLVQRQRDLDKIRGITRNVSEWAKAPQSENDVPLQLTHGMYSDYVIARHLTNGKPMNSVI